MSVQQQTSFGLCQHTLFLDFLKHFCQHASRSKLHGTKKKKKTHFLDLQIKSYECLKFQEEVWAGRACAAVNEKELTTCAKSGGQEEKKIQEKWEQPDRPRRRPTAGRQPLVASRPWTADLRSPAGRRSTPVPVMLSQFF
jgi:hypothetical protein